MQKEADFLAEYFEDILGYRLNVICSDEEIQNSIRLESTPSFSDNPEAYQIIVAEHVIKISAGTSAGIFYGIQTLRKSLPVGSK